MVVKLYISGISGNKEVKKKQQRVQMILDSKQISYEAIDITEPGKEKDKEFMQQNGKVRESLGKYPLPPQIFNDDNFCGDYEDFDLANEVDELEKFLHIQTNDLENGSKVNGLDEKQDDTIKMEGENVRTKENKEEVADKNEEGWTAENAPSGVNQINENNTCIESEPNEIIEVKKENSANEVEMNEQSSTEMKEQDE